MIYVKDGVQFKKLIPEIFNTFPVIDAVWKQHAGFSATIERNNNDVGIGLRTINLSTEKRQTIFDVLFDHFTPDGYTVTFENRNMHGEHIFIGKETK